MRRAIISILIIYCTIHGAILYNTGQMHLTVNILKSKLGSAAEYFIKTPEERVAEIEIQLKRIIGPEVNQVKVRVIQSGTWNAYVTRKDGYLFMGINSALINDVTDDELAVVMGHEFAHLVLGHVPSNMAGQLILASSKHQEKMADYFGLVLAMAIGVDPDAAYEMWERLILNYGDYIHGVTHPSPSQRAFYLKQLVRGMK